MVIWRTLVMAADNNVAFKIATKLLKIIDSLLKFIIALSNCTIAFNVPFSHNAAQLA